MKTCNKKYYKKNRTLKKRGGAGAAAAADERFKCPFSDRTYSAMSNIYIHCKNKHPNQPMPRLTHDDTVVRGAAVPEERRRRWPPSHPSHIPGPVDRQLAANGQERFKCPFCDKTYTAITNIYGHCRKKHPEIQMIRLTYDNTIVRPVAAASSGPAQGDLDRRSRFEFRSSWARGQHGSPPPLPPAAAAVVAVSAAAAPSAPIRTGQIVSRTGTLQGNSHYITNPIMIPNFQTSHDSLHPSSTYMDWVDLENKSVLDALNENPDTLVFKINDSFCVITKGELFTLMNNPDSIKYECNKLCKFHEDGFSGISKSTIKDVPYFSISSFSQFQGLISFSDLWHIVSSQQPQDPKAYELVELPRPPMLSIASHNFLFGPGSAGARAVSAAHCQEGQDASDVYEIRILPIATRSRSRAATTIQRMVRGHQSRRNPR